MCKVLGEKDYEIRVLNRKREEERQASQIMGAGGGPASDTAASKIVDLSKKIRELTSELESERTRSKQLARKCKEMEKDLAQVGKDFKNIQ